MLLRLISLDNPRHGHMYITGSQAGTPRVPNAPHQQQSVRVAGTLSDCMHLLGDILLSSTNDCNRDEAEA